MSSITAVSILRFADLWEYINQQKGQRKVQMLEIYNAQCELNDCWFWQRAKKKQIKQKLDMLFKHYPVSFRVLYKRWKGER